MNRVKSRVLVIAVMMVAVMLLISGCGASKTDTQSDKTESLNDWAIKAVVENYSDGDIIREYDIVVDRVYYGSFSQESADEILVLCKILDLPHVAGLDKTVGVLMDADSLDMIAYREFPADKVVVSRLQTGSGRSRILVSKTSASTGLWSQEIQLLAVEGSEWIEIPIDALDALNLGEKDICFVEENQIIAISGYSFSGSGAIMEILTWNPEMEQFVPAQ
ncbi:MAG: hypothetical protein ACI4F8_02075 [Lachnospiraceae bacterium]